MPFHHPLLDLSYSHVLYLATLQIQKSSAFGRSSKHDLYVFCAWLIKLRYLMNTILKNIFNCALPVDNRFNKHHLYYLNYKVSMAESFEQKWVKQPTQLLTKTVGFVTSYLHKGNN